jgi:hypothetical protein
MKGKNKFTNSEASILKALIKELEKSSRDKKKSIRGKMRKLNFYISDFTSDNDGFDLKSFEKLVSSGNILVSDSESKSIPNQSMTHISSPVTTKPKRENAKFKDEYYVIDLCDKILGENSLRQYKFEFLTGDPNERGISAKLPVDAYYPSLKLVIEYRERQHTESVNHFDKPDKITISGVHRGLQRKIYDERRRNILPKHGISLVEISYTDFAYNSQKRIIRDIRADSAILRMKLIKYLSSDKNLHSPGKEQ